MLIVDHKKNKKNLWINNWTHILHIVRVLKVSDTQSMIDKNHKNFSVLYDRKKKIKGYEVLCKATSFDTTGLW